MTKKLRPLTAYEKLILYGMKNTNPMEFYGPQLQAISKEEMKKRDIENAKGAQNHKWPWEENART